MLTEKFVEDNYKEGGIKKLPANPLAKKKESLYLIGDEVRCESPLLLYPFDGEIIKTYSNSGIVKILKTNKADRKKFRELLGLVNVSFEEMILIDGK